MRKMDSEILTLLRKRREGLSLQKIVRELHLSPLEKSILRKKLERLKEKGIIFCLRRRYYLPPRSNLVRGRFVPSSRGYGFVTPEGGAEEDIFIPARYCEGARRGDVVEVLFQEKGKKGKPEGRVIHIVERGSETVLGFYQERWGHSFFLPFDSPSSEEVPLTLKEPRSLRPGTIIEVDRDTGRLVDILGMPDEPGVDTRVVIRKYGLAAAFPEQVLKETEALPAGWSSRETGGRKDYRRWTTVTIDGENAQDFDDAVSIRKLRNGNFLLGVHIADVSHYVLPGSALDTEAYRRGTSVYFPDLTLPMLPERLSNDVCSLRPQEERLTFSVLMVVDPQGRVIRTEFHPSVIQTAERMTYTSVFRIFQGNEKERKKFSSLVPDLLRMKDLARRLRKRRGGEGSLDFDLLEAQLVYREGELCSVIPFLPDEAHKMVEDFMVTANEAVATFLSQKNVAVLYRVHPRPGVKDLERLRELLVHFGLSLPSPGKIGSRDLQRVLNEVEGTREEKFITLQVLKSMKLAVYSPENVGHYGLAKKRYTHFTSPIRRYPDLAVHRILKAVLQGERVKDDALSPLAAHCSEQERTAAEAERGLLEWRIFRFLKQRLGDEFEGTLVDISRAGLVVELDDYLVDGTIPFADLDGDYYQKKTEKTLLGRRTGRTFELGDRLRVTLVSVDPIARRMGFILSGLQKRKKK